MNDTFAQFIPLLVMLAVIAGAVYFVIARVRKDGTDAAVLISMNHQTSSGFVCPSCRSDNISKVSLIVANQTKSFQSSSTGIGFGLGGGVGIGTAGTTGTSQSAAAAQLSPPKPKPVVAGMVGLLVGAYFSFHDSVAIGVIVASISLFALIRAFRFNRYTLPKILSAWNELYLCQRCATVFKINN